MQRLTSGDLCSCSFVLEKDVKTKRKSPTAGNRGTSTMPHSCQQWVPAMGTAYQERPWLPFTVLLQVVIPLSSPYPLSLHSRYFFSLGFHKSFISWLKYESLQYLTLCKMGCWQRWVSWGTSKGQPSSALELLPQHQRLTGTQVSTQK